LATIDNLQEIKIRLPTGGTTNFGDSVVAIADDEDATETAAAAIAPVAKNPRRLVVVLLVKSGPDDMWMSPGRMMGMVEK